MATVNFSVPDDVRDEFNAVFDGRNKSAVIADLMREAVARARRKARSDEAIERIVARLPQAPRTTAASVSRARRQGRP